MSAGEARVAVHLRVLLRGDGRFEVRDDAVVGGGRGGGVQVQLSAGPFYRRASAWGDGCEILRIDSEVLIV